MAKRYGRNQKRRHREQIAAQAEEIEDITRHRQQEIAKRQQLMVAIEAWDADIRRLLGEYTAFRLKTPIIRRNRQGRGIELPIMTQLSSRNSPADLGAAINLETIQQLVIALKAMVVALDREDVMDLRRLARVKLVDPDGRVELHLAYEVERRDLVCFGERDRAVLANELANEIAKEFVSMANKDRGRGYR